MPKKPEAPDYFWFQALRVLYEEGGEYSEQFQWWQSVIAASEGQELIFTEDFCSQGEPDDLPWDFETLSLYGSEEVLANYARKILYGRYCT